MSTSSNVHYCVFSKNLKHINYIRMYCLCIYCTYFVLIPWYFLKNDCQPRAVVCCVSLGTAAVAQSGFLCSTRALFTLCWLCKLLGMSGPNHSLSSEGESGRRIERKEGVWERTRNHCGELEDKNLMPKVYIWRTKNWAKDNTVTHCSFLKRKRSAIYVVPSHNYSLTHS